MPTFGYSPHEDPLGVGLKSRAKQSRWRNRDQTRGRNLGPLSDPQWDAFFQAMDEQNVSKLADSSVGAARGMWDDHEARNEWSAIPSGPARAPEAAHQDSAALMQRPSRQFNARNIDPSLASLDALDKLAGAGKYYQPHEEYKKRFGR